MNSKTSVRHGPDLCAFFQGISCRTGEAQLDALLYRVADKLLVLAASGARLVLAVAGSNARGTEHRRTDALALRVIARTTGKTCIRRRIGVAPANVAGRRGGRPNQHDHKQSTQDPLQHNLHA